MGGRCAATLKNLMTVWRTMLMKRFLLVALVALGATVPALAADLAARRYTKAPPYAAPIYNWTGFYIGGHNRGALHGGHNLLWPISRHAHKRPLLRGPHAGPGHPFDPRWHALLTSQYRC